MLHHVGSIQSCICGCFWPGLSALCYLLELETNLSQEAMASAFTNFFQGLAGAPGGIDGDFLGLDLDWPWWMAAENNGVQAVSRVWCQLDPVDSKFASNDFNRIKKAFEDLQPMRRQCGKFHAKLDLRIWLQQDGGMIMHFPFSIYPWISGLSEQVEILPGFKLQLFWDYRLLRKSWYRVETCWTF